ncbi:MAG: hypothetical protein AAFY76_09620 [Cyanobacteria bacterium J06649_11]
MSFTGHSLGGGLASANALATSGKAVTFNAAGISNRTKASLGLTGKSTNITAYIVQGEILDFSQRNIGMKAEGQRTIILPSSGGGRAQDHKMQSVIDGFKSYQEIMSGPHKTFDYIID